MLMENRYSPAHPTEAPKAPEEQYSYYRRCQRFRKNGQQCKAPAMKGQDVCYQHEGQEADESRRRAALESLQLPPLRDSTSILRAIEKMAQAVIEDRVDLKTIGGMLNRLQSASLAVANPQPRAAALHSSQDFNGSSLPIILDLADEEL